MSNVVLNIRAEGRTLDEAMAAVSGQANRAREEYLRTQNKTFYFNVYKSDEHAFAIGSKAHKDSYSARSKASRGYIGSFSLTFNPSTGLTVNNAVSRADCRYFVVTNEGGAPKFSKGYATRAKAEAAAGYGNAQRVVAVAVTPGGSIYV
jgi:hypothetical protein